MSNYWITLEISQKRGLISQSLYQDPDISEYILSEKS